MSYRPRRAPRHRVAHRNWRRAYITNSSRGSALARAARKAWVDNDFHLSLAATDWINAHGAPERFWLPRGIRFERKPGPVLLSRSRVIGRHAYRLRDDLDAFTDNAAHGLSTEAEIKDVRPYTGPRLRTAMVRLAKHAAAAYGPDWHKRVVVKVLTDLHGGEQYALKVCAAAHAAGIPTMLLARGRARFRTYAGHPEVTYVRGSLVIRRKK